MDHDDVEVVRVLSQDEKTAAARAAAISLDADDAADSLPVPPAAQALAAAVTVGPPAAATAAATAAAAAPAAAARATSSGARLKAEAATVFLGPYKNCVAVAGDTRAIRATLKQLGGQWNSSMVAWVFPADKRDEVLSGLAVAHGGLTVVEQDEAGFAQTLENSKEGGGPGTADLSAGQKNALSVSKYKKAILVRGDTLPVKAHLKSLGGRWNRSLGGWVFGSKEPEALLAGLQEARYGDRAVELFVADDLQGGGAVGATVVEASRTQSPSATAAASAPKMESVAASAAGGAVAGLSQPKRACSAYILYSTAMRDDLKRKHPDASIGELAKLTGAAWKSLGRASKATFDDLASMDKERFKEEMAAFRAAGGTVAESRRPRKKAKQRRRSSTADGFINDR